MSIEMVKETETKTIKVSDVVFREDLYPRIEHNQQKAQEYAENLDNMPPILVNQHNELIDGKHRWVAHRLKERDTIDARVIETSSDEHLLELAIETNRSHGLQMSQADKKKMAIRFYAIGDRTPERKKELAKLLSVSVRTVTDWVYDLDKAAREARNAKIREMWFQCYTADDIGNAVGLGVPALLKNDGDKKGELTSLLEDLLKVNKVQFSDESFTQPVYNIWSFGKKTNATSHFGNTEQRIVENLLWAYTQPGEIVIDPFGGGGSTLDVCIDRGRRCWISDRKPKPGLEDKIRAMDITQELPPLNKRWSDVALVYLDPPYWKQAENQYSTDAEDLANYESEDEFHDAMAKIIKSFSSKMRNGSHIALIIQPTQWKAKDRQFVDHVFEITRMVGNKVLTVENRVSCPYSTEQCLPQMVEWAKENKKFLVLTRELVIWSVTK